MPALLLKLWKPIAIVALIAGLLIYREVLVHQRNAAIAQVKTLTARAAMLQASNAAMQLAVKQQNAAVESLRQKLAQANFQAAQYEREFAAKGAREMLRQAAKAHEIQNAPVPPGCAGAIEWGNAQGPELGKW